MGVVELRGVEKRFVVRRPKSGARLLGRVIRERSEVRAVGRCEVCLELKG